jgi:hypothetical protein
MDEMAPVYRVVWDDARLSVRPLLGERDGFLAEVPVPVSTALGPHHEDVQLWLELRDATYKEDEGWESLDARLHWNAERQRLTREVDAWLRPDARVELPRDPAVTYLRLMPEYCAGFAVWGDEGLIVPDGLGLTEELVRDVEAWNLAWEMDARFENQPLPAGWLQEGHRLRAELQRQLGPDHEVVLDA